MEVKVSTKLWLTTGEAAEALGVSRQHVVDLCDRGVLSYRLAGTHRRLSRDEVEALLPSALTREKEKSLWLHRALLGRLMAHPNAVLDQARGNIEAWLPRHRHDSMAAGYLRSWQRHLDEGVDSVVPLLTGTDEYACELRQNSPFAGVLPESERRQVLLAFREHWNAKHAAA